MNVTSDPGVKDALGFLMTREIAHQKSFEKALYSIQENFPPGKIPGVPEFTDKYYNCSQGEDDDRGPWNKGHEWEYIEDYTRMSAVDGGSGEATVSGLSKKEKALSDAASKRLASMNGTFNPTTGADLGAKIDGSAGRTKEVPKSLKNNTKSAAA